MALTERYEFTIVLLSFRNQPESSRTTKAVHAVIGVAVYIDHQQILSALPSKYIENLPLLTTFTLL